MTISDMRAELRNDFIQERPVAETTRFSVVLVRTIQRPSILCKRWFDTQRIMTYFLEVNQTGPSVNPLPSARFNPANMLSLLTRKILMLLMIEPTRSNDNDLIRQGCAFREGRSKPWFEGDGDDLNRQDDLQFSEVQMRLNGTPCPSWDQAGKPSAPWDCLLYFANRPYGILTDMTMSE